MGTVPDLTDEQRSNLKTLAAYLRTLPADYPDFEMSDYVSGQGIAGFCIAAVPVCGTAACACGHGPAAGIAPMKGETWDAYSVRAFIPVHHPAWSWCFSGEWSETDNTVHGAAARIEWMLERGVPADADDQESGNAPLCYTQVPA